jgi:hypothetical protein
VVCLGVPLRFLRRRFLASPCKHLMLAVATMFVFLTDDSQADDLTIEIVSLPPLRIEAQGRVNWPAHTPTGMCQLPQSK